MFVIKPTVFTDPMLISTTATEVYSAYSAGTTYDVGNRIIYNNKIYESLQAANTGHTPDTSPTWWLFVQPDNKHAMFDQEVGTATIASTTLTVVIATGLIDSFALINLNTDTVKITVRDGLGGSIIYEQTGGLSGAFVDDWFKYFFYDPLLKRTQLIFREIPPYATAHVTLEFTSTTSISIGAAVWGSITDLGLTQYGATAGIVDYSKKETNVFGNITFIERAYSKRMNCSVMVPSNNLNRIQQLLYSLRATPAVWIGTDDPTYEETLVVYGWYKDFSSDISYPSYTLCNLSIEGLI